MVDETLPKKAFRRATGISGPSVWRERQVTALSPLAGVTLGTAPVRAV